MLSLTHHKVDLQDFYKTKLVAAYQLDKVFDRLITEYVKLTLYDIFTWSDTSVALRWRRSSSNKWTSFVANRVRQVQGMIYLNTWRYKTTETGGMCNHFPPQLVQTDIWWSV